MTISLKVDHSHKYSFNTDVRMIFRILLVPEKTSIATGFHYIIVLDSSGSMEGIKIEKAKSGAIQLFNKIPKGNKVSFITFSDTVNVVKEFSDPIDLSGNISSIVAGGQTVLFTALLTAINIAKKYEMPSYIILLTDGNPTDVTDYKSYQNILFPNSVQIIPFGIGDDYNETLLKILSDRSGTSFYHIEDASEIPEKLPKAAKTTIAAKNITVDITSESKVSLLNYSSFPIHINALEGVVKILGEAVIPPNFSGNFITVKVSYDDPVRNVRDNIMHIVSLKPATDNATFIGGINRDLIMEYDYYSTLQKYSQDIASGNLVEATRTLRKMEDLAQQTRRIELIETTRRLSTDLENTKRTGSIEQTRRLSKEVSSEVTRKLRGES